jgi:VanZ family protein
MRARRPERVGSGIADPECPVPKLPPKRRFFVQFTIYWLPVLAYLTAILWLSSEPNLRAPTLFHLTDKFYHVLEYFGFGVLLARALRSSMRIREPLFAGLIALAMVMVVGASDEYFQSFIPGRDSSVFDLLADTAGGAVAQLVFIWVAGQEKA